MIFKCGADEVGRGPLAGPVVAAAVLLRWSERTSSGRISDIYREAAPAGVADSKSLSSGSRAAVLAALNLSPRDRKGLLARGPDWSLRMALARVQPSSIDRLNIHRASLLAMGRAFQKLYRSGEEGELLVDGKFTPLGIPARVQARAVIKGDQKHWPIALASIIAKEHRDCLMANLALRYPGYGFEGHAGYPTAAHKGALKRLGPCPIHRRTFRGVRELL